MYVVRYVTMVGEQFNKVNAGTIYFVVYNEQWCLLRGSLKTVINKNVIEVHVSKKETNATDA